MHAMLQGLGEDSILDFEAANNSRKIGSRFQGTLHPHAISGLKKRHLDELKNVYNL
jgi:hypothetical protein